MKTHIATSHTRHLVRQAETNQTMSHLITGWTRTLRRLFPLGLMLLSPLLLTGCTLGFITLLNAILGSIAAVTGTYVLLSGSGGAMADTAYVDEFGDYPLGEDPLEWSDPLPVQPIDVISPIDFLTDPVGSLSKSGGFGVLLAFLLLLKR